VGALEDTITIMLPRGRNAVSATTAVADGWVPFLPFAGPDRIPELLDRVRTASVATGRSGSRSHFDLRLPAPPANVPRG
jgi:hypothetical protein